MNELVHGILVVNYYIKNMEDQLMMYLTGWLFQTAIADYEAGLGETMRSDLILQYERLSLENLKYVEKWRGIVEVAHFSLSTRR